MANIKIYEADFENDYMSLPCNVVVIEVQVGGQSSEVFDIYRFYNPSNEIKIRAFRRQGGVIDIYVQSFDNTSKFNKIGTFKFGEISKRDLSEKAGNSLDEVLNYIDQVISGICSY